jgi:hypothetical protein
MKFRKKYSGVLVFLVVSVMLCSYVSAFAVSSPYYKGDPGNPMIVNPGESKELILKLQNLGSEEDIRVKAEVTQGADMVTLVGESDIFLVPAGEKTEVPFLVNVPAGTELEKVFSVSVTFSTVADSESGSFAFGSRIGQDFEVIAGPLSSPEQPELAQETANGMVWILIGLIVLILVIWWALKGKKDKSKKSK